MLLLAHHLGHAVRAVRAEGLVRVLEQVTVGPNWLFPAMEGALLIGLVIVSPHPHDWHLEADPAAVTAFKEAVKGS